MTNADINRLIANLEHQCEFDLAIGLRELLAIDVEPEPDYAELGYPETRYSEASELQLITVGELLRAWSVVIPWLST